MEKKFTIDFFELGFLAEACIPPRPIARAMFWDNLMNKYYYQMSDDERNRLFSWITTNGNFDKSNEDCRWFFARFNPDNQYLIETECEGEKQVHEAFRFNDEYHVCKGTTIQSKFIINVVKVNTNTQLS